MNPKLLIALALAAAACGAQLGDANVSADASSSGSGSGSSNGGTDGGAGSDGAAAACANGRQLFLEFNGVTLTQGSPSNAVTNRVSWMTNSTANVPPYRQNDSNRLAAIQTIVDGVKTRLASTPINVVTTRPAAGPYVMIVFGGSASIVGTIYSYATNEHDCGDVVKSDVGWISDAPSVSYAQDLAVGAIGWGLGLNGTNDPTDCMCAWANGCSSAAGACTLSASIPSTTSASPATTCPNQNPQNEVAAFSTGFCQ